MSGRPASGRPARRRPNPIWLGLGIVGWAGLAWLAVQMYSATPRTAAFDLELLLQAGRDVAAGRSPYDPAMVAGGVPGAADLFYSYPPPVAQAMSLFAAVPSAAMFAALWVLAIAGLAYAAALVSSRLATAQSVAATVLPTLAVAPLFLPFAIALLFGNLDALFPLAYALVLVAAVAPTRRSSIVGGVALALATVAKVHPAGLGPWFVGRAVRERQSGQPAASLRVILAAAATVGAVLVLSLLAGGADLWRDYVPVAGAASNARLLDPRNAGPAAQVALLLGGDEALVRALHLPVAVAAVLASLWAGWAVRDRLSGIAVAGVASLVLLPVTWYHYADGAHPVRDRCRCPGARDPGRAADHGVDRRRGPCRDGLDCLDPRLVACHRARIGGRRRERPRGVGHERAARRIAPEQEERRWPRWPPALGSCPRSVRVRSSR